MRDVRRSLDEDIENLGSTIKINNIVTVPILVIALALLFWRLRLNRRRQATAGA